MQKGSEITSPPLIACREFFEFYHTVIPPQLSRNIPGKFFFGDVIFKWIEVFSKNTQNDRFAKMADVRLEASSDVLAVPKNDEKSVDSSTLNIVFDLNGTLLSYHFLDTPSILSKLVSSKSRKPGQVDKFIVEELEDKEPVMWDADWCVRFRPHVDELLEFLFETPELKGRVRVGAWTFSGKGEVAIDLARIAFGKYFEKIEFVWDGRKATSRREKDLQRVYDAFPGWNANNTIIVDDSPYKIIQRENAYMIPTYEFHLALARYDDSREVQIDEELVKLKTYISQRLGL
jgi:hypothetical protein